MKAERGGGVGGGLGYNNRFSHITRSKSKKNTKVHNGKETGGKFWSLNLVAKTRGGNLV